MNVRRIRIDDVASFRELRLRALRDDPDAFDSSYEQEVDRPLDTWATWAALSSDGPDQAMFLAEVAGELIGLAGAFRIEANPRTMHLIAMWVDPRHRRAGVGSALTETILGWARRSDADEVTLWVVEGNDDARRLYERAGFEPTAVSKPLPSNPDLLEHQLVRPLGTRLRMPDGYVELEPMAAADVRAFVEWVIADRTARLMEAEDVSFAEGAATVRANVGEMIDAPPGTSHHFFTLKAGVDPDPRGWVWLTDRRRDGRRIAIIEDLVVFEDFRGRGLASSAVDAAIMEAGMIGITTVEASISAGNVAALRIATSCGFIEVERNAAEVTFRFDQVATGR